jgi:Asp-tRNA(Asn)/Glu-tRNA(Gln) amidotransferase A subunit family amidase
MSTPAIVDRLRANLRAAGIAATDEDIEGIASKGFLRLIEQFDALVARERLDLVPDYLGSWAPPAPQAQGAPEAPPAPTPSDTLLAAAARLRAKEISPLELTEQALARIAERDPLLNAFQLVLDEQAREQAREAEREILAGTYRGPLHGIPVAVKDLLAMKGTRTTAGSKILADNITDYDAAGVERLRAAGAVIVGKTRLSEFAYAPASINAHYGPTRNPASLEHDTGGSSSGSAAAVADGLVFAALGTDTGGSIRIPAALCGIVGIKPTFGRVSLFGCASLAWSLDHLGPLTRSVADAAAVLAALCGYDARDARTRPSSELRPRAGSAQGLRVGVLSDDGSGAALAPDDVLAAWRQGLRALEAQGVELVEVNLPELNQLRALNNAVLAQEALAYHQPSLRARLDDFGPFMRQRILAAYAFDAGSFVRAQQLRGALRARCEAIFARVDLLSTPTVPAGAPPLGTPSLTTFTGPFNLLGWPTISIPSGTTGDGLPVGLQLAGRPWEDETVLRAAGWSLG